MDKVALRAPVGVNVIVMVQFQPGFGLDPQVDAAEVARGSTMAPGRPRCW